MSYHLFLDDARKPSDVTWIDMPSVEWVVCRNIEQFKAAIYQRGIPKFISFDHDLADEHYQEYYWCHSDKNLQSRGQFRYDKMKIRTGYCCAKWLVEYCSVRSIRIPDWQCHTLNPVGKQNIDNLLSASRK